MSQQRKIVSYQVIVPPESATFACNEGELHMGNCYCPVCDAKADVVVRGSGGLAYVTSRSGCQHCEGVAGDGLEITVLFRG